MLDIIVVNREVWSFCIFFCQRGTEWTEQWTACLLCWIQSCLLWNAALNRTGNNWNLDFSSTQTCPDAFWGANKPFSEQTYTSNLHKLLCSRIPFIWMSLTFIIHYFSWQKIMLLYIFQVDYDKEDFCPFIRVNSLGFHPYVMKSF